MKKIVLASHNKGKIREFNELLQPLGIELILQSALNIPEADETGITFIENALIKARHAARLSGLPSIADDSGLAVAALNGAPGIHSARYAGPHASAEDNIRKLLADMANIQNDDRQAEFHCVLAFLSHANDPTPLVCDGKWQGIILREPRGANGFGYDPVFFVPEENQTAAELAAERKHQISHRGQASAILLKLLPDKL